MRRENQSKNRGHWKACPRYKSSSLRGAVRRVIERGASGAGRGPTDDIKSWPCLAPSCRQTRDDLPRCFPAEVPSDLVCGQNSFVVTIFPRAAFSPVFLRTGKRCSNGKTGFQVGFDHTCSFGRWLCIRDVGLFCPTAAANEVVSQGLPASVS